MKNKLWGGRFKKKIDKDFYEFQKSIQYDHKLAEYDILHSLIHVAALGWSKGVLSGGEKNKLIKTLKTVGGQIKKNKFKPDMESEDIHTDIQNKIEKKLGKLALKLHTLRSRNDQIVFDEKLYCYDQGASIANLLNEDFLKSLKFLENKYKKLSIVGYTHTQRAQKVALKDYLGAFYCMFQRDRERLDNFWKNIKVHIGAGALAGSSIRKNYGKALKEQLKGKNLFITPSQNTLDDVSDRDFIIEFLAILSIVQMHLSRLAEDLILYSTKEFNFIDLPEEFCTGSSFLPHKKNPDLLELVRGYTGKIYGNLLSVLTTMKGLPLTYNRDMQLDKEPLFSSVEIIKDEIKIMSKCIKGIRLNKDAIEATLTDPDLEAVKLVENLVFKKGIPFRQAHNMVGRSIASKRKIAKKT